jgi:hypothetical protein
MTVAACCRQEGRTWYRVLEYAEEFGISASLEPFALGERRGFCAGASCRHHPQPWAGRGDSAALLCQGILVVMAFTSQSDSRLLNDQRLNLAAITAVMEAGTVTTLAKPRGRG